jgi:hypothetical protein
MAPKSSTGAGTNVTFATDDFYISYRFIICCCHLTLCLQDFMVAASAMRPHITHDAGQY